MTVNRTVTAFLAVVFLLACPAVAGSIPDPPDVRLLELGEYGITLSLDTRYIVNERGRREGGVDVRYAGGTYDLRRGYRRRDKESGTVKYRAFMRARDRCAPAVGRLRAVFEGDELVRLRFRIRVCFNPLRNQLGLPKRGVTLTEDDVTAVTVREWVEQPGN